METDRITQEVILNLNASFCKREWCEKTDGTPLPGSPVERLKTICWDGMLPSLLPEISVHQNNKPLILWEMVGTRHLLHLKLGDYAYAIDPEDALQPAMIAAHCCLN